MNRKFEYYIMVSEPWGFAHYDGTNVIMGKIIEVIDAEHIIFQSDHKCQFERRNGDKLVLYTRYHGDKFDNHWEDNNTVISVNGWLLLDDYKESMTVPELIKKSVFAFIGTLRV